MRAFCGWELDKTGMSRAGAGPDKIYFCGSGSGRGTESYGSGTEKSRSLKQRILHSLMSHWKLVLALRSSILFSKDWTLASRMLGRGTLWALFLSLLQIPARFPQCFLIRRLGGLFKWPLFYSAFRSISNGHDGLEDKVSWNRLV